MDKEIKEYSLAVMENLEASKDEAMAKDRKKKAHYRLIRASEALRSKERELLTEYIFQ